MNFKARSKINLKFSEKSYPINGFRELFKYLLDVLDCVHKLFKYFFSDERDAIQKKTFTKWVNKHLKKVRTKK